VKTETEFDSKISMGVVEVIVAGLDDDIESETRKRAAAIELKKA